MSGILIVIGILILVGVILTACFFFHPYGREDLVEINIEPGRRHAVEIRDLNLYPGKENVYSVLLYSDVEGTYKLKLAFEEIEEHSLKQYVYAAVEVEGEILCEALLADLFVEEGLTLSCDLKKKDAFLLTIRYSMPEEVGNEAQGAKAIFDLVLTASKE